MSEELVMKIRGAINRVNDLITEATQQGLPLNIGAHLPLESPDKKIINFRLYVTAEPFEFKDQRFAGDFISGALAGVYGVMASKAIGTSDPSLLREYERTAERVTNRIIGLAEAGELKVDA